MEGQRSQSGLTRTHSSLLLRSSPTTRSSVHSLSSIGEDHLIGDQAEENKPRASGPGPARFSRSPVLALASLILCLLFFFFFYFFCIRRGEISASENLLLALIFVAVSLLFAGKNKGSIHQSLGFLKQLCYGQSRRLGFPKARGTSVQWFIGESAPEKGRSPEKRVVGEGVEAFANGDFYEGEFHRGRCNGSGVYYYFVGGGRYEGDWIDGKYDGYGVESWARGSRYRGQYRQGLRHGFGVYRFYSGDSYAGEWFKGQSHGAGVQICSDGSCYVGEFQRGVKHGLGCYHFRNGDRYAGEYFGDKIHGFGVYHFANGHCYEGSWHEGRNQGYGAYTFRNAEKRCGEWGGGGALRRRLHPLSDAVLKAVQAARKKSEDAARLRKVDEQVSKAVAAANKAATAARVASIKAVQNRIEGAFCDRYI